MKHPHLVLPVAAVLVFVGATSAFGQSEGPRLDIGAQASVLRLSTPGSTSAGVGPRITLNLSRWFAVDGEVTYYPHDDFTIGPETGFNGTMRLEYRRRRSDAFVGVKVGQRGDRFGIFGKVRPGVARLTHVGVACAGEVCPLILIALPEYRNELAIDLGGILEYYPTARTFARLDLGDVLIRHRSAAAPPCARCTSHNFTSRIGFGVRF